ncbi:MAG: GDSL-type esterase/lipase family protein [Clostridiales bacterium]|jgi:hypothetical protein|nr:GDSL-type esterase/lipase family protein [Clostridiales bacterium]
MKRKICVLPILIFALFLAACGGVVRRTETVYVPGGDYEPEQAAGVLTGRATYLGEPVSGVTVTAGGKTAVSNRSGVYALRSAELADGEILFHKDGYIDARKTATKADFAGGAAVNAEMIKIIPQIPNGTDAKVNLYGRTVYQRSDGADEFFNVAAGFEVAFYGTELTAETRTLAHKRINQNYTMHTTWRVLVDGSTDPDLPSLDTKSWMFEEQTIVSGLPLGVHTVKVMKSDDPLVSSCLVRNYRTDGAFLPAPEKPALKIEAFGDSITSGGDNLLGWRGHPSNSEDVVPHNSNGAATYITYAALNLGAQLNVMSEVGICLTQTAFGQTKAIERIYGQISPENAAPWDMTKYIPDIVVVGLGTNDQNGNMADFVSSYKTFIKNLAAVYGKGTVFVLVHGFWDGRHIDGQFVASDDLQAKIQEVADDLKADGYDMHRVRFEHCPVLHPDVGGHKDAGDRLTAYLKGLGY